VGISAYDAFVLAADPAYHPEQLDEEGVDLWQPKRLFLRHWNEPSGGAAVTAPVGAPFLDGMSYADLAAHALREHAAQGMRSFAGRFSTPATYFTLLRKSGNEPLSDDDLAGNIRPPANRPPSIRYLVDAMRIESLPEGAFTTADSLVTPGSTVRLRWSPEQLP